MCIGFMSFGAPTAALKQKNQHISPNMKPIVAYLHGLFKFMKRHLLDIVPKQLNVFCLFLLFAFLLLLSFQRYMHSIFVWNVIK